MKRWGWMIAALFASACGDDAAPATTPTSASESAASTPEVSATASPEGPSTEAPPTASTEASDVAPDDNPRADGVEGQTAGALAAGDTFTCALVARRLQCAGTPPSELPSVEADLLAALPGAVCLAAREGPDVRCFGEAAETVGHEAASARWEARCQGDPECVDRRETAFLDARRRDGLRFAVEGGVRALAASSTVVCALGGEDRVICWDFLAESTRPLRRLTIAGAVDLAMSEGAACARLEGGGIRCWEEWGDPAERVRPSNVRGVSGAARVAVGADLACAWDEAGEARCWGGDWAFGVDLPDRGSARVRRFDGFDAFAFSSTEPFGCGLRAGRVECVGDPRYGRLGRAGVASDARPYTPAEPGFPAVAEPRRVVVGASHACALDAEGALFCWGSAADGALGASRQREAVAPVEVAGLRAQAIVALRQRTCARTSSGWRCWGPASSTDRRAEPWRPAPIDAPSEAVPVSFGGRVCARFGESLRCPSETIEGRVLEGSQPCRLTSEGALECRRRAEWDRAPEITGARWLASAGSDLFVGGPGQITRVAYSSLTGVFTVKETFDAPEDAIELVTTHRPCVRRENLVVTCRQEQRWVDLATPPLVEVAAGLLHSCGRSESGEVWCWGSNASGQLARPRDFVSAAPVRVEGLGVASALAVGMAHTCALVEEGAVRCWGAANEGELGVDPGTWIATPVRLDLSR
ncbi:MAG: hypothetical protein KF901_18035 [Myxococcales bacterium]|nr:hypothetical protein [Myxococcales bacterium]